jgi:hypothetical protein
MTTSGEGGGSQAGSFEELAQSSFPSLRNLHDYWRAKKGERIAPPRSAIRPEDIPALLSHIALFDVIGDPPRLRYRVFGTGLVKAYGQDLTGKFVDEVDLGRDSVKDMLACTVMVVRECRIHISRSRFTKEGDKRRIEYERILLPLSEDGKTVNMILCGYAIEKAYG